MQSVGVSIEKQILLIKSYIEEREQLLLEREPLLLDEEQLLLEEREKRSGVYCHTIDDVWNEED